MNTAVEKVKAQAGKILRNANELYTLALISFGLPAVFWIYIDRRAALAVFVVTQIALGIIRERE